MEFTALRRSEVVAMKTPLGELVLRRSPEEVAISFRAQGRRNWRLELDGRPLGGLLRFLPGRHAVRAARRGGLTADFEGAQARITARTRHLLRSRRYVQFEVGGRTLRFVRRGLVRTELQEGGRTVGRTRSEAWELSEPDRLRVFAIAVFAWGGLEDAVENPLLPDLLSELIFAPLS